ncbi:hypothetical protein [Stutzerimonas xanthomarina]|uniref:Uncharacterized protein n=2 Tax=Stutzerimonas xanthomarina TaxID=271420 RepID=A0A1M5N9V0_9GAMM|nr:hypothetical protein [Stutzerimonas xanthomarina]MCP9337931.1 hypothetical protein [Stutzerimonas xanthomarina]SEH81629.1 hypothetical protein SAMN05216535_2066 [Stutzerimonas xanthomarina]SHG86366.1 hypothetical protein SAMN02744645_1750 [Stutzerimonas xanthomarina DSM 18231]
MSVPVDPRSKEDGFEHHDADVNVLLMIGFGLLAALALSLAGVGLLVSYYESKPEAMVTPFERETVIPPQPRLENNPFLNAQQVMRDGEEQLRHYAWVDRAAGIARIPLRRAQDLLLERGWPAPAEPGDQQNVRLQQAKQRAEPR